MDQLLLIREDIRTSQYVADSLQRRGYSVAVASGSEFDANPALADSFDLILIDHKRRCQHRQVSGPVFQLPRIGPYHYPRVHCRRRKPLGHSERGVVRPASLPVGDQFDAREQTAPPNIAD